MTKEQEVTETTKPDTSIAVPLSASRFSNFVETTKQRVLRSIIIAAAGVGCYVAYQGAQRIHEYQQDRREATILTHLQPEIIAIQSIFGEAIRYQVEQMYRVLPLNHLTSEQYHQAVEPMFFALLHLQTGSVMDPQELQRNDTFSRIGPYGQLTLTLPAFESRLVQLDQKDIPLDAWDYRDQLFSDPATTTQILAYTLVDYGNRYNIDNTQDLCTILSRITQPTNVPDQQWDQQLAQTTNVIRESYFSR